ncbi:MAG: DinB family protein [Planctomycetota bacterium]
MAGTDVHSRSRLRELLVRQYTDVQRGTKRLLQLIPADKYDWAPAPGMRTLRELAGHLAVIARYATKGMVSGEWEMPESPATVDRDIALAELQQSIDYTLAQIADISDAEFERRLVRMPWGPEMTVARAFAAQIEHEIHHRTQLYIYLKILGVDMNSLTLFG